MVVRLWSWWIGLVYVWCGCCGSKGDSTVGIGLGGDVVGVSARVVKEVILTLQVARL